MTFEFTLNGEAVTSHGDADTPLLYTLRDELGLNGVRYGCGAGECGACTVLADGEPINSCDAPVWTVEGKEIETVESFERDSTVAALIHSFIEEQAAQCAYCSAGIIMTAAALLRSVPAPTREQIDGALEERLCRCGAHNRVVRAIERAARAQAPEPSTGGGPDLLADPVPDTVFGNQYVQVFPDGVVAVSPGKVELGQGISTSLSQIAADALGVRLGRVRVRPTDTATSPDQGVTHGSLSIAVGGVEIREAALALKDELLSMAAGSFGVDVSRVSVDDGTVTTDDGRSTSYWEVLGGADTVPAGDSPAPALGESACRWDLPAKLTGGEGFIQDLRLPGMLHGRVVRPPESGLELDEVDARRASSMPGLVEIVSTGRFLGVVAEGEHQAIRAAKALENDSVWARLSPVSDPSRPAELPTEAHDMSQETVPPPDPGVEIVTATYSRPFLAHASIGPSCAIALFDDGELTVWTHSQGVFSLRTDLARSMRMSEERVRVIHAHGSGCYGHNGADDAALDAALLAEAVPGRPVRLQWSREDEFLQEPYGPAMRIDVSAGLDRDRRIVSWSTDVWSQTHSTRPGRRETPYLLASSEIAEAFDVPAPRLIDNPAGGSTRNGKPLYEVGDFGMTAHLVTESAVRTSALRSLGAHANVFAIESHMDELASRTGIDPKAFRIRHLSDRRAIDVIERVAEMAGVPIGGQSSDGHGYGLGFAQYKNFSCYVAVIAEVVAEDSVRVPRIWAAADAGLIVNPDGALNQLEGGCVQSASWALKEQVPVVEGRRAASTWSDYPILRFGEIPDVSVELIDRPDEPSVGVGEGSQGPTTAAIANGLRAVLGVPIRDLPFTRESVERALLS